MKILLFDFTSGALLLLIFLVITISGKINKKGNGWLAFFLITVFFFIADESFSSNGIYRQFPGVIGVENMFIFLAAPSLYLSVLFYVSVERQFLKKDILHFLPAILFFPIAFIYILQNGETKLKELAVQPATKTTTGIDIFLLLIFIQIIIYLILSSLKLVKHRQNTGLFSSNTETIDLKWLQYFVKAIGFMLVCWIFNSLFPTAFFNYFSAFAYLSGIFFLAYHALRQKEIYPFAEPDKLEIKEILKAEEERSLPEKQQQRLSEQELENLKAKLQEQMELKKYYLEDTLSLPKLAQYTETTPHNLSYAINKGFGENFFQFVNRYRVEEARRLLLSSESAKLNMLGIAFECGFSSKTTFNTTFKKMTGVSPSEFVRNHS